MLLTKKLKASKRLWSALIETSILPPYFDISEYELQIKLMVVLYLLRMVQNCAKLHKFGVFICRGKH